MAPLDLEEAWRWNLHEYQWDDNQNILDSLRMSNAYLHWLILMPHDDLEISMLKKFVIESKYFV